MFHNNISWIFSIFSDQKGFESQKFVYKKFNTNSNILCIIVILIK